MQSSNIETTPHHSPWEDTLLSTTLETNWNLMNSSNTQRRESSLILKTMSPLKMKEGKKRTPIELLEKDAMLQKVQINRPKRVRKRKVKETEKIEEG